VIVKLAIVAIIAGSVMALAQSDLKKMLCYLIVAEVGYMVGGAWLANHEGMVGAIYHIISDAFMTLCLFLAAGIFFRRTQSHSLSSLEGMFRKMPWTMAGFTVGAFAMIGIPPTCGFFSKWYLIQGGMAAGEWGYVVALLISSLVNAVLFFRIIEIGYFGVLPEPEGEEAAAAHGGSHGEVMEEAPASMLFPLLVTAAGLILLGIFNAEIVELIAEGLKPLAFVGGGAN
jgi:multicomponent Na+:H+ antiporter subunit D